MKKRRYLLVIPFMFFLMVSLVCLVMMLVPGINKLDVYQTWLFWWNAYCLGLILVLCVSFLLVVRSHI